MIRACGLTDIGIVRDENQDVVLILEPPDDATRRRRGTLVAVADGMGGLGQGRLASKMAIEALSGSYHQLPGDVTEALSKGVEEANRAIYRYAQDEAGGEPMGSTMTAAALLERYVCVAQVGDSRAYHYRQGELRQITRDHSLVRELADRGELDPESYLYRHHRNVLTRGLGLRGEVEVDLFELPDIQNGDLLLLSSDGLHELLSQQEMLAGIEAHGADLDLLCRHFIELARSRGGPDNITVAVAQIGDAATGREEESAPPEPASPQRTPPARQSWFLPLAMFLSFAAGAVLTVLFESAPPTAGERFEEVIEKLRENGRYDELQSEIEKLRGALED
jgi:protein phosphatase